MPNLAAALKQEVARLARKEVRAEVAPLKAIVAKQRKLISELKLEVAALRKAGEVRGPRKKELEVQPESGARYRFVPKGLVTLRTRLGISLAELAFLLDVSSQSISNWQSGSTRPREQQLAKLGQLRTMGKKEVRRILEARSNAA